MAGALFTINGISGWKLVEMIAGSETLGFLSLDARFPVTLRLLIVPEPLRSPWGGFPGASATTLAAGELRLASGVPKGRERTRLLLRSLFGTRSLPWSV